MGKIMIGNSNLSKCYVGNSEVSKIYVGDKLVYEKQSASTQVTLTFNTEGERYRVYDGTNDSGTLLDTFSLRNYSNTYTITSGHIYLKIDPPAGYYATIIMSASLTNASNLTLSTYDNYSVSLTITTLGTNASGQVNIDED